MYWYIKHILRIFLFKLHCTIPYSGYSIKFVCVYMYRKYGSMYIGCTYGSFDILQPDWHND